MIIFNIEKKILKNLIKEYFEFNELDEKIIKQIDYMVSKLTDFAKESIVKEFDVIFYVKNKDAFVVEPSFSKIKDVSNPIKLYLYFKLLDFFEDKIDIIINKINNKKEIEIFKIINAIIFTIDYTKDIKSFTLNLDKIDNLYSEESKKLAKGAKKSVISTLTKKHKERFFRVHFATKNRIVDFDELANSNKLDLGDKEFNCQCPICKKKYTITKNNINNIIQIDKNNIISFRCNHITNTNKFKEPPFKIDLNKFMKGKKYTKEHKQMFFINNFKKLTELKYEI